MKQVCAVSGQDFTVSDWERSLRQKFDIEGTLPTLHPQYRFREIGAFWPQWNLHKRTCDRTGKPIISIFRPDCAYPVWHRDEWMKHADPPVADVDFSRPFFEQAWDLFQRCPLPNNFQSRNQNCEYTDDWYKSKDCYMCHSGQDNEGLRYCYACDKNKDLAFSAFSFYSELCSDIVGCQRCFDARFLVQCRNVQRSAFLYDCRQCQDCMFCYNLRNKQYCFGNQQLTKAEYEAKVRDWNLASRTVYDRAKQHFADMMRSVAWHRSQFLDHVENSTGNYLLRTKNCENCYFLSYHEDCANVCLCGPNAKMILDSMGTVGAELSYYCSLPVYCYRTQFCFSVDHCRFCDYSAYCFQCEYCFGCCGLVNKKYCIFNKQYSKDAFFSLREKLLGHMQSTGEWGQFFPGYFAPNPYDESWSGFYFSLSDTEKQELGFRSAPALERSSVKTAERSEILDLATALDQPTTDWLTQQVFWDETYQRPFQIQEADIALSQKLALPLPNTYYMNRLQENISWMPFTGDLRSTVCAKSQREVQTCWPDAYETRILSEDYYLSVIQ